MLSLTPMVFQSGNWKRSFRTALSVRRNQIKFEYTGIRSSLKFPEVGNEHILEDDFVDGGHCMIMQSESVGARQLS